MRKGGPDIALAIFYQAINIALLVELFCGSNASDLLRCGRGVVHRAGEPLLAESPRPEPLPSCAGGYIDGATRRGDHDDLITGRRALPRFTNAFPLNHDLNIAVTRQGLVDELRFTIVSNASV